MPILPHRTFHTLWSAPLWGDGPDRVLTGLLIGAAAIGVIVLNETNQRPAARLLGLGAGGFLILATAGVASESLGRFGTPRLLVPALWFAALPAAHAFTQGWQWLARWTGGPWRGAVVATSLLALAGWGAEKTVRDLVARCAGTTPLVIGLTAENHALVEAIRTHTTPEARILWEDFSGQETASQWTALLPLLTERSYLGGLDPDACIEHTYASLVEPNLAGRPLAAWSDADLEEFCRRYNIGWVVCRSSPAIARFRAWPKASLVTSMAGDGLACLYRLRPRSMALKGQARLLHADWRHITLADVVPEDGMVVLSLHYQAGLRVSPSRRVQIEKEPDPNDPIPFIRLRLPGPVARLTLTWQEK
jgi:hypothetical protein